MHVREIVLSFGDIQIKNPKPLKLLGLTVDDQHNLQDHTDDLLEPQKSFAGSKLNCQSCSKAEH